MRSTGWCRFDLLVHIFGEMGSTKTYHLCTWTRNRRFQQCRFMMVYESWAWAFEDVRNARLAFTWHLLLGYLRCSWHLLSAGMFFVEDTIVGYRWPELVVTFCIISIASLVTQTLTWPTMPHNAESDMHSISIRASFREEPFGPPIIVVHYESCPFSRWQVTYAGSLHSEIFRSHLCLWLCGFSFVIPAGLEVWISEFWRTSFGNWATHLLRKWVAGLEEDDYLLPHTILTASQAAPLWGQIPFPFYRTSISKMQICRSICFPNFERCGH